MLGGGGIVLKIVVAGELWKSTWESFFTSVFPDSDDAFYQSGNIKLSPIFQSFTPENEAGNSARIIISGCIPRA